MVRQIIITIIAIVLAGRTSNKWKIYSKTNHSKALFLNPITGQKNWKYATARCFARCCKNSSLRLDLIARAHFAFSCSTQFWWWWLWFAGVKGTLSNIKDTSRSIWSICIRVCEFNAFTLYSTASRQAVHSLECNIDWGKHVIEHTAVCPQLQSTSTSQSNTNRVRELWMKHFRIHAILRSLTLA